MIESRERLSQFVVSQGISNREFCKIIFVAPNYLSQKGAVQSDVLFKIYTNYPQLNFDWVITGRGSMLVENLAKCGECEALEKELNKEIKEHKNTLKELSDLKNQLQPKALVELEEKD